MASVKETIQVTGIRCERCLARLAHVLKGHPGLESANASFNGEVVLRYEDTETDRAALVDAMRRGGFRAEDESR